MRCQVAILVWFNMKLEREFSYCHDFLLTAIFMHTAKEFPIDDGALRLQLIQWLCNHYPADPLCCELHESELRLWCIHVASYTHIITIL